MAQITSVCETFATGPAPTNFAPPPNGNDYPGPYYLRVYIHILQTTDLQGQPIISQTSEEIEQIISRLNSDFNPHNIYFNPVCEVDVVPVGILEYDGVFCDFINTNRNPDGIDIFLLDDDLAYGRGRAESIPGTMLYIKGRYSLAPYNPLPPSHVTSHEMGHCLGLWHTHHGTRFEPSICPPDCQEGIQPDPNQCAELVNGSNSETCGDLVEDTPADPLFFYTNVDQNCQWNGNLPVTGDCNGNTSTAPLTDANGMSYNPDVSNIMAVTPPDCMQYFTPGQGQRMRKTIAETQILQNCLIIPSSGLITEISSNTEFDVDMDMPGDIIVHSGAELLVTAKIGMPQGSRILVERNARLIVETGGILTRACETHNWNGVQVLGNNQLVQPEHWVALTNPNQAGIVWIDGGIVEWARTGISAGGGYGAEFWGGLVRTANTAIFRNNRKDVEFMSYKPFPTATNKSRFVNTFFTEIGESFANTEGVTIWETDGIRFDHCTFSNKDREGIRTFDAAIYVHNETRFENNETGVSSYATYPMSSTIKIGSTGEPENEFTNNEYHINASLSTGMYGGFSNGRFSLDVINNKFNDGEYGVIVEGASNFRVAGNLLTGVPIGGWASNAGFNNVFNQNLIGCNTFKDGKGYGILAIGENKQMQFLANDFQMGGGGEDFLITNSFFPALNGAIRATQGNKETPAANCFTNPGQQVDIQTWGSTEPFTYFYQATTPLEGCDPEPLTPGGYDKALVLEMPSLTFCNQFGGLPAGLSNPTPEDLNSRRTMLYQLAPYIANDANTMEQYYQVLQEKDEILRYLLDQALASGQYASAEGLLVGEQSRAADWAIFGLRMERRDYNNSIQWLNALSAQSDEEATFREVQIINLQRLENPTSFLMTAEQELYLNAVAEGSSPVRGYARGLLGWLKDRRYYPETITFGEERNIQNSKNHSDQHSMFKVSPVPASTSISISWPLQPTALDTRFLVYDLYGRQQINKQVAHLETQETLGVSHLPNGMYVLIVSEGGRPVHQCKLSIQH